MSIAGQQIAILVGEALLVAAMILLLFRLRARLGLMPLAALVGCMQYLQTILSSTHYIQLGEYLVSPGSAVLFPSALFAVLLLYLREGVLQARALISGLLIANLALTAFSLVTTLQIDLGGTTNLLQVPAAVFELNPRIFVAGTAVLVLDVFLILMVYEVLLSRLGWLPLAVRLPLALVLVLALDAIGFVSIAFGGQPEVRQILAAQLVSKTLTGSIYGLLLFAYLRWTGHERIDSVQGSGSGVFAIFTYQERYALLRREKEAQEAAFANERQESRQALVASESRYRTLFGTMSDGLLVVDAESLEIVDLNPAFANFCGHRHQELLGRRLAEAQLFDPGIVASISPLPRPEPLETLLRRRHRQPLEVELRISRFVRNDHGTLVLAMQDISARRTAERSLLRSRDLLEQRVKERTEELATQNQRLAKSEQRYRDLFDNMHDLLQAVTPEGELLLVNQAWKDALGYGDEELAELNVFDLIHPRNQEHCRWAFEKLLAGEEIGLLEAEFITKSGESLLVEGHVNCLFENGKPVSTRGIFRDVTERRAVERLREQLIATVSHELRTPVTSIYGSLNLVADGKMGELPEKASHFLDVARRNAKRLTWLINDILDFHKINAGMLTLDLKRHDLVRLAEQAVEESRGYACQFEVAVELEPHAPVLALGDRQWLLQVMANLLSNAIKHSPKGGTVRVTLEDLGSRCRVLIRDHGLGISEDFSERVFQPFAQMRAGETGRGGVRSTGLGLSIAKALLERMDGTIDFETEIGSGTTFHFELPVSMNPYAPSEAGPHALLDELTPSEVA